jgi:hypothetical protein|uniref:Uncharacterized protein n=1 Tax=Siphoviridae sp. ctEJG5 TaxID=2827814 RepID=A0A8S5RX73_9CAUD|nr:MAG TPA: hypothetical protein [Siphoviridae sp. ctEJG5]
MFLIAEEMRVDVQMRNNAITIQELRVYLAERYGIRKGNRIKYTERGEEKVEHIYEVDAIYPHCVLLRDIFDNTRICPCYGKLRMMLNEIE